MEGPCAAATLISVMFVLAGVSSECIYNDNDNLMNLLIKKQDNLQEKQDNLQEKVQELQLEHAAKIQELEMAAMKEKLQWHEEMNKLKTERIEERLALNNNKPSENINCELNNGSSLALAFLSQLGININTLQNIEDSELRNSKERITEQISRLLTNSGQTSEIENANNNSAMGKLTNKLNEIQTTVDNLQVKVEDIVGSRDDSGQEVLLTNNTSTSHKGLDQVRIMVQGLQEKVNELTASRQQLQQGGRDRDSVNETFTNNVRPRYCHDYYIQGERRDGVFTIYPGWNGTKSTRVWCEFDVGAEVGWTIIIARMPTENPVDFSRGWDDYKAGFGDADGEYWIGLTLLNEISLSHCSQVLQVNLQSWDQTSRHAQYKDFGIGDEESGFKLSIGGYSGDAADAMAYHNGNKFTTKDKDNDSNGSNCAIGADRGGFWYGSCYNTTPFCVLRKKGDGEGMRWNKWLNEVNLKKITFKIAPRISPFI